MFGQNISKSTATRWILNHWILQFKTLKIQSSRLSFKPWPLMPIPMIMDSKKASRLKNLLQLHSITYQNPFQKYHFHSSHKITDKIDNIIVVLETGAKRNSSTIESNKILHSNIVDNLLIPSSVRLVAFLQ